MGAPDSRVRAGASLEAHLRGNRPHIERQIDQLAILEGFALPLVELLGKLPAKANWGDWLPPLTVLAETALRAPESVLAVLSELGPMADVGPVSLGEVYGVLQDRLRFLRADPAARRYGAVFCGTIEEARAHRFAVVFLPGLAEGIFPRRAYEDPLLLDHYRIKLEQPIARRDQLVARERLLLSVAAAAADTRLVVSYPRDGHGPVAATRAFVLRAGSRAPPRGRCPNCADSRARCTRGPVAAWVAGAVESDRIDRRHRVRHRFASPLRRARAGSAPRRGAVFTRSEHAPGALAAHALEAMA
jgi:hypothetical protein